MHVLFVHKNFPAQFGHIAAWLVKHEGFRCTFVSELPDATIDGVRRIQYRVRSGATAKTHYLSRTFENYTWHSHAVYETLQAHSEIQPDLIVGHSGFGSTLFLADLYRAPIVNYFEYYYRGQGSDMDFRPEFPTAPLDVLRCRTRNAALLADLATCAAGYSPTDWQRSLFPAEYQGKLETIFDGIDTALWRRLPPEERGERQVAGRAIPTDTRIVTYVSRGFESMRGFDIFMKVAKRICDARSDVVFVCVGSDRICYGGDEKHIAKKTFREHVLAQDDYDLSRFIFTGRVPRQELARILNLSDLHIYLTVPFVLSWSLMDALACGATVLASGTPPVREMIRHERNGLLADFYDVEGFTKQALAVLDDPAAYRPLGEAGTAMIEERYSLERTLPRMLEMYRRVVRGERRGEDLPTERVRSDRIHAGLSGGAESDRRNRPDESVYYERSRRPLRILATIPHFYRPQANGRHGSLRQNPQDRIDALRQCVAGLLAYSAAGKTLHHARRELIDAHAPVASRVDVVLCTTKDDHLLREADLKQFGCQHQACVCDPKLLGFECHAVLRERLGDYDYYCYLEDDLILRDPAFFDKLRWFTSQAGPEALLQPNRYEAASGTRRPPVSSRGAEELQPEGYEAAASAGGKLYMDGDMAPRVTARFQNVADRPALEWDFLGRPLRFRRTLNPHAGCFFLTAEQMEHWAAQPYFLDRDTAFIGPLESAATLGILRAFRVYKTVPHAATFLEVQHYGAGYLGVARSLRASSGGQHANAGG